MVSPPLWSDDPLPHGHAARSASAAFSAQNASGSEYRQSRTSAMRMSRKSCLAERSLWAAEPHEGAGGQAVDTCRLSPVWNTGCFTAVKGAAHAGAAPCVTHSAISTALLQSLSANELDTECEAFCAMRHWSMSLLKCSAESDRAEVHLCPPYPVRRNAFAAYSSGFRRESCGPECRGAWPAEIFNHKTLRIWSVPWFGMRREGVPCCAN